MNEKEIIFAEDTFRKIGCLSRCANIKVAKLDHYLLWGMLNPQRLHFFLHSDVCVMSDPVCQPVANTSQQENQRW